MGIPENLLGKSELFEGFTWEVLNGVGVDGVGGSFPFFYVFFFLAFLRFFVFFRFSLVFFVFFRFSAFFFVFLGFSLILLEDKGGQLQFTAKMGNFTPTPSAPTPCATSRFTTTALEVRSNLLKGSTDPLRPGRRFQGAFFKTPFGSFMTSDMTSKFVILQRK